MQLRNQIMSALTPLQSPQRADLRGKLA